MEFLKDCLCKLSVSGRFIKWNSNRFLVDCDHAHEKEIYPIELIRDNLDLIIRRNWFSSNYRQKFSMIYQFRVLTCSAVIISAIYNFPPSRIIIGQQIRLFIFQLALKNLFLTRYLWTVSLRVSASHWLCFFSFDWSQGPTYPCNFHLKQYFGFVDDLRNLKAAQNVSDYCREIKIL